MNFQNLFNLVVWKKARGTLVYLLFDSVKIVRIPLVFYQNFSKYPPPEKIKKFVSWGK